MASTSPAAPGLTVESAHAEALTMFRSDSALECAALPRVQGVPANAVVSVWMASDEEDALAAGEFTMSM